MRTANDRLIDTINALLPQTQCQQCEYDGCLPYAAAIASGDAINKCPPGGEQTIARLASLLELPVVPLDRRHGEPGPRTVAFVRESECIGCTLCIQVCPTDAILGAAKKMHTVIEPECTGCELCVAPCPVDCIDMIKPQSSDAIITNEQSRHWQKRHESRKLRLQQQSRQQQTDRKQRRRQRQADSPGTPLHRSSPEQIQAEIRAAVARSKARKEQQKSTGNNTK